MTKRFTAKCPNIPGCIIIQEWRKRGRGRVWVEGKILVDPEGGEGRRMGRVIEIWVQLGLLSH